MRLWLGPTESRLMGTQPTRLAPSCLPPWQPTTGNVAASGLETCFMPGYVGIHAACSLHLQHLSVTLAMMLLTRLGHDWNTFSQMSMS